MIKVGGELCYSPHHPDRYGRGPVGIGPMASGDIQLWNLIYLSTINDSEYLDPSADLAVLVEKDMRVVATSMAALKGKTCKELFPQLRSALQEHPSVFLQRLWTMPWEDLPLVYEVPYWKDGVIDKVANIEAEAKLKMMSMIRSQSGNVTHLNFGRSHG